MARGTPLSTVRSMLKAELQKSLDITSNAQDSELNQIIFDVQQWLASEYDWPFLRARWDVVVTAGTRYLAYPTTDDDGNVFAIDFERAGDMQVFVKWNQVWQEVEYGIREMEEYNYIDSDRGQVLDPIQRWMFDDQNKFEVWPIPATTATVRFIGQRVTTELRQSTLGVLPITWNDGALLDLDDQTVVLYGTSEYLLKKDMAQASALLLQKANTRMANIRATYPKLQKDCIIGRDSGFDRRTLRIVPMIVVGGK